MNMWPFKKKIYYNLIIDLFGENRSGLFIRKLPRVISILIDDYKELEKLRYNIDDFLRNNYYGINYVVSIKNKIKVCSREDVYILYDKELKIIKIIDQFN